MAYLWRLRTYFRQVAGLLVVGSLCGIVMNTAIVLPAVLLGRAINTVLAVQSHHATLGQLLAAVLVLIGGTAATELPRIGKRYWLGVARTRIAANLRADALRGVLAWPPERLGSIAVGELMARIIGDVDVIALGVGEVIVETWDTVLFSISLVLAMFAFDWGLAAISLSPVPVALLIALLAGRLVAARTLRARRTAAVLTRTLHEQIGAMRLLRLYGRARAATATVATLADQQAAAELSVVSLEEALGAIYSLLLGAGALFIIAIGGSRAVAGAMSIGALVAFLQLFVRFTTRAPRLPQMFNRVQAGGAAYERIAPLLAPPTPASGEPRWSSFQPARVAGLSEVSSGDGMRAGTARPATLRLQNLGFTYPGLTTRALAEIDLDVPAGSMVAITGPVGSGKSTLSRLSAGLLRPTTGQVLLDGRSPSELAPSERALSIGYLAQDPHLFSGTVAENVTMWKLGTPGDRDRIRGATAVAALTADVEQMPHGLDTEIGELGIRISGGQRLRVALARALAAGGGQPGLLVLDDPFSAVDVETEAAIIRALHDSLGGRSTILLFSHRLAAFRRADLVVVLQGGRIAEKGTHAELVGRGGLYSRIVRAQARLEGVG